MSCRALFLLNCAIFHSLFRGVEAFATQTSRSGLRLRAGALFLLACAIFHSPPFRGVEAFATQISRPGLRLRAAGLCALHSSILGGDDGCCLEGVTAATATSTFRNRRQLLQDSSSSLLLVAGLVTLSPSDASAIPFLGGGAEDKRQLELCLVTVLRVKYWAMGVSKSIDNMLQRAGTAIPSDIEKAPYLEARLGAKSLLTGRVGGGANQKVYTLAGLQLKGCLKDAEYWANLQAKAGEKKDKLAAIQRYATASEGIVESLAACVEFDGLETTLDPSPRSSLMLGQYTNQKAQFLTRMLKERVIPSCDALVKCFDGEARERSMRYLKENYYSELPPPPPPPTPPSADVNTGTGSSTVAVETESVPAAT